jgi:murein L,D-transpeptidase YcbB/YkuD
MSIRPFAVSRPGTAWWSMASWAPEGFAAMNVPIGMRLRQMETNLVRIRSMSGFLGDRYVMVNIPAAALEAINSGRVTTRHTAIVGKVDRPTPILDSRIHELNFNPYWTVPVSIIRRDLIPLMQENPNYLAENNIRIFSNWGASADELRRSRSIGTPRKPRVHVPAGPGEINSLGSVKINFHNEHQVYLHDTPVKSLFGEDYRFLSSGCVRVQNIRELVTWLLANTDGWSRQRIDQVIATGERD